MAIMDTSQKPSTTRKEKFNVTTNLKQFDE
jgi:hypothetical protein